MANIKQQKKRIRLAAKQRLRNRHAKSTLKTLFKQLEAQLAEPQSDEAAKTATFLPSRIDKAAAKGILHKNNAARKKSRVARMLARLSSRVPAALARRAVRPRQPAGLAAFRPARRARVRGEGRWGEGGARAAAAAAARAKRGERPRGARRRGAPPSSRARASSRPSRSLWCSLPPFQALPGHAHA